MVSPDEQRLFWISIANKKVQCQFYYLQTGIQSAHGIIEVSWLQGASQQLPEIAKQLASTKHLPQLRHPGLSFRGSFLECFFLKS